MSRYFVTSVAQLLFVFSLSGIIRAADWPMFGRDPTRNAVSPESKPPVAWDFGRFDRSTGKWFPDSSGNIKWVARLGSMTCGDPVVADGLVWVGTNNHFDDDFGFKDDASVLACFRETDGKLLYTYISPRLPGARLQDWPHSSIACSPLVSGDKLWFVSNRWEAVCLDIGPLKRGEGEPIVVWKLDMMKELGVHPYGATMHYTRFGAIAMHEHRIYVMTGNGVDFQSLVTLPGGTAPSIPAPEAPSLVCLRKDTGELLWKDNSPGANILSGQWAAPLVAEIEGRCQVIAAQGDGWLRGFDAESGSLIWQFDMNKKSTQWLLGGRGTRNSILATPVLYNDHIYLAVGQEQPNGEGLGRLCCIKPTMTGDVSSQLAVDASGEPIARRRLQAVDPTKGERAIPNPNSGLVWEYTQSDINGDEEIAFEETFHRAVGSVAIKEGLLITADFSGLLHCFDAATGKQYWSYDLLSACHSTPLIVGDKIYVADEDGELAIFNLSSDPQKAMKDVGGELSPINSDPSGAVPGAGTSIFTSPIYANNTLFVATRTHLFAIEKQSHAAAAIAGYWPQWRGPKRDNVSVEEGLLPEWPDGGPPLDWLVEGLGEGIASVAIARGRIHTVGYVEDSEYLFALDQLSGELIWATRIGNSIQENRLMRWLSQRCPTVDFEHVYYVRADGDLVCLRAIDGVELWRKSYLEDFKAGRPLWGHCDYPLVDGNRLVISPGSPDIGIAALNKLSGDVIWQTKIPGIERSGHAAVVAVTIGNVPQYLIFSDRGLHGVRATDGRILWNYDKLPVFYGNRHTPIVQGDRIFCASRTGVAALKAVAQDSVVRVEELYQHPRNLDPFHDTLTLVDGHVYGFQRGGMMLCYSATTGEINWGPRRRDLPRPATPATNGRRRRRGSSQASLAYADSRLYVRFSDGNMALVEANPREYVEKGKFVIPDHQWALGATATVIAGGRMYLRDDNRLFCYDVRDDVRTSRPPRTIQLRIPRSGDKTSDQPRRASRSVFVPTPHDVVTQMLELANVKQGETVYDLGSGDGRIVIKAAQQHECHAIGYEIDPGLVEISRQRAREADVAELASFEQRDIFTVDLSSADVVAVYLLPIQLEKLMPQFDRLKPGARIVSHYFAIPGATPEKRIEVESKEDGETHQLYLWTAPLKVHTD